MKLFIAFVQLPQQSDQELRHLILGCNKSSWPTGSQVCTRWMPSLFI